MSDRGSMTFYEFRGRHGKMGSLTLSSVATSVPRKNEKVQIKALENARVHQKSLHVMGKFKYILNKSTLSMRRQH